MRLHPAQLVTLSLLGAALIGLPVPATAQVPGPAPRPPAPVPRPTVTPPRADTTRADSTKADSTKLRDLIKWTELDSTANALMARPGYSSTRYQGVRVRFDAKARTLYIEGEPAAVGRGVTLLVGDTIVYNDSTKVVVARGDTLILRDPTQNAADVEIGRASGREGVGDHGESVGDEAGEA